MAQGEDVSLLEFTPMEFRPLRTVVADAALREGSGKPLMCELTHTMGLPRETIENIFVDTPIRLGTLRRIQDVLAS